MKTSTGSTGSTSEQARYCYIDIDINNYRKKLALAASFVHATDTRHGFTSKKLRELGGAEVARIKESIATDHDWKSRYEALGSEINTRGPVEYGNRLIVELDWDSAPLACQNFATLCCENNDVETAPIGQCGKPLSYVNSNIHRIIPGFMIQGGDFVFGNGSGGESIYNGKKFKDEKGGLVTRKHDKRGVLSMGNSGKNSNTSQFFITFQAAPQCDGKHVIFGELISGFDLLDSLEQMQTCHNATSTTATHDPCVPVRITSTGAFIPFITPSSGYWYDQPDESFLGHTPIFISKPRILLVLPTHNARTKFTSLLHNIAALQYMYTSNDDHSNLPKLEVQQQIMRYLEQNKVDLVFVAFACRDYAPDALPSTWTQTDQNISLQNVVFVLKPMDAISALQSSWMISYKHWTFDF